LRRGFVFAWNVCQNGQMKRVLVVDDEESIRLTLSALLGHRGYHVVTEASAAKALEIIEREDVDVVLADVRMPEMDGIELTRRIVAQQRPVTIIVMSAYGSVETAIEAMKAGAYDYITKPFKTDEVILTLAKAEEREALRRENAALKAEMVDRCHFEGIIGRSEAMEAVFKVITKIADYKSTVLVTGESGTGKELVARAVHNNSSRAKGPFVAVNCGAIPEALLESELFGYKRGAFTDAHTDKTGLFAEAEGGTLLLDEIGELPLALQVKLLRVLQESTIRRVGDTKDMTVDVRIVAATIRNLERSRRGHHPAHRPFHPAAQPAARNSHPGGRSGRGADARLLQVAGKRPGAREHDRAGHGARRGRADHEPGSAGPNPGEPGRHPHDPRLGRALHQEDRPHHRRGAHPTGPREDQR
jgi:DNA-binding NtrC family response regulator